MSDFAPARSAEQRSASFLETENDVETTPQHDLTEKMHYAYTADGEEIVSVSFQQLEEQAVNKPDIKTLSAALPPWKTKPVVLYIAGGPGCGKGTLCDRLKEDPYGFVHLSTGDILREEQDAGTEIGKYTKAITSTGGLVAPDLMLYMEGRNRCL